ncbi:SDR family NAD(P)-dependent oxidoreductase [Halobaculum sp. MBLA0147]|uniref:SDR family NAD(P)-dependent oxidoreductase n=1 Tax=Halobaculum sp. MBLA0147 TaxID=3079934 RepID=UPI0035234FB6
MTATTESEDAALVTGASSGIGAALALEVAADGYDLVLTARREAKLEAVASEAREQYGVAATVLPQDLAEPDGAASLADRVAATDHRIDRLINSAGFPTYGPATETDPETARDQVTVNATALTELTVRLAAPMAERRHGGVVNVGSAAGYYPAPRTAVYAASKAYVNHFSRAVAAELEPLGVTVSVVCPTAVDTEFVERGGMAESGVDDGLTHDPVDVARTTWNGHLDGERVIFPDLKDRLVGFTPRLLPHRVVTSLGGSAFDDGTFPFLADE